MIGAPQRGGAPGCAHTCSVKQQRSSARPFSSLFPAQDTSRSPDFLMPYAVQTTAQLTKSTPYITATFGHRCVSLAGACGRGGTLTDLD